MPKEESFLRRYVGSENCRGRVTSTFARADERLCMSEHTREQQLGVPYDAGLKINHVPPVRLFIQLTL